MSLAKRNHLFSVTADSASKTPVTAPVPYCSIARVLNSDQVNTLQLYTDDGSSTFYEIAPGSEETIDIKPNKWDVGDVVCWLTMASGTQTHKVRMS